MRLVAEQHPVGRGQRQRVASGLFPCQVLGTWHQLLRLHIGKLGEGSVGGLVAPDTLAGGIHRIAAVALFVVAVILVAVDHDFVADLPAFDLVANRPDDARRVRARNVEGLLMAVEGADGFAQGSPDTVIVHTRRHHEDKHLVTVERRHVHDLFEHRGIGVPVAFLADGPCVHLLWNVAHRRDFPDLVKVFFRCVVLRDIRVQGHVGLHSQNRFVPQCRIAASTGGI